MKKMIELKAVSKSFKAKGGTTEVARNVSFDVAEGEFVVLVGPGQCGKSTLINLVAGLELPDSGEVIVDGKKVLKPEPTRGVVYQTTMLFPWLTVMGNVGYGPRICGMKKKQWQAKAKEYIDLVGLTGFEKSYPVQLSGGMRQRVGIARAYCSGADVILMDEPFGHLDAQTRWLMQEEVIRLWQREKKTVVFVTNNIEEAVYLADRVLVLGNCPTSVQHEFVIDLPRPRDYVSPDFMRLRQEIGAVIERTR